MDSSSLLELLPELLNQTHSCGGTLNQNPSRDNPPRPAAVQWAAGGDAFDSDPDTDDTSSETDGTFASLSQDQGDGDEDSGGKDVECQDEQDTQEEPRQPSPKPVDLDEIEKFLDGITRSHRVQRIERVSGGRPASRDMAAILREVDELGRRTLSSTSLPGDTRSLSSTSLPGGAASRPPPSPRHRSSAAKTSPSAPATPASSETALLSQAAARRVHFSQQQLSGGDATPETLIGAKQKLSVSEPAIDVTAGSFHELLSQEKRKNLNLTADMILLKQSSLEHDIQLRSERDEQIQRLLAENATLKAQVDYLAADARVAAEAAESPPAARLRALEQRLLEQERLLDGFNQENARLYRQLKSVKTEREQLEMAIDDLQCDKRLLEARLQASQRRGRPASEQHRELAQREKELEERWLHVQRAGQEVARLHQKVQRQDEEAACEVAAARRWDSVGTVSTACQTEPPPAPMATTAEVEVGASLRQAQVALLQNQADALQTQTQIKKEYELKVRALETKLRRLHASPARSDADLLGVIKRLKAQLCDKERHVTQTRRQLEKVQKTAKSLQRERERLLAAGARTPDTARTPENDGRARRSRTPSERPQRGSPSRGAQKGDTPASDLSSKPRGSPVRGARGDAARRPRTTESTTRARGSPVRGSESTARSGGSPARKAAVRQRAVDDTLLRELQIAIAAVEEENVQLKDQLSHVMVHQDEEVARRDAEIAALRAENQDVRSKLSLQPSPTPRGAPELLSARSDARSDSLMEEARSQMEAQEEVIRHLRETIRRFRHQMYVMEELERDNVSLRQTVGAFHQPATRQRRDRTPETSKISLIESKLDEIDRQSRKRAAYLHDILQQLGQYSLSTSSLDGSTYH